MTWDTVLYWLDIVGKILAVPSLILALVQIYTLGNELTEHRLVSNKRRDKRRRLYAVVCIFASALAFIYNGIVLLTTLLLIVIHYIFAYAKDGYSWSYIIKFYIREGWPTKILRKLLVGLGVIKTREHL